MLKIFFILFFIFASLFFPVPSMAIDQPVLDVNAEQAGFEKDLGKFVQVGLNSVLLIAAVLVLFQVVWAGLQWITSGGDKGKTEEARNKIVASIIGIAIVAASYAIFRVVLYVLGIENPFDGEMNNIPTLFG